MEEIVLFGAGSHARVVLDILEKEEKYRVAYVYERNPAENTKLFDYPVVAQDKLVENGILKGLVAIGDNWTRAQVVQSILSTCEEFEFISTVHPSAQIGKQVSIGAGSVVMAGAVINPCTHIAEHTIVNTQASIDHDCQIAPFASVNPGAVLGGDVSVGTHSAVGIGAIVKQGTSIGEHSVVGAGSVVVQDVPDSVVSYGNPAKVQRYREPGRYL